MALTNSTGFYPSTCELEQKVEMIRSYTSSPYDSKSIFKDLMPFVGAVESDLIRLKELDGKLDEFESNDSVAKSLFQESLRVKRRLLTCFQYFELGHQIYLRGTYADFSTDHQYGMSYLGNIRAILRVLNSSIRRTFDSLDYDWSGFITYSNFLTHLTAEASIVVLPFFTKNSVEFVNDWLLITHEMGHIYFWDFANSAVAPVSPRPEIRDHKLLDEVLADLFSLEVGYSLDFIHLSNDFDRVRKRYQDPRHSRYFQSTYEIRKLAALLYCCARANPEFASLVHAALEQDSLGASLILGIVDKYLDLISDIVCSLSSVSVDKALIGKYIRCQFIDDPREPIRSWYQSEKRIYGYRKTEEVETIFVKTILNLASGTHEKFKRIRAPEEYVNHSIKYPSVETIAKGTVVYEPIGDPFRFIKELIDYCDDNKLPLDSECNAPIRVAAIYSLYGQVLTHANSDQLSEMVTLE